MNRKLQEEIRSHQRECGVFVPLTVWLPRFDPTAPPPIAPALPGPENTIPGLGWEQLPAVAPAASVFLVESLNAVTPLQMVPANCLSVSCLTKSPNVHLRLPLLGLLGRKASGFSTGQTGPRFPKPISAGQGSGQTLGWSLTSSVPQSVWNCGWGVVQTLHFLIFRM